MYIEYYGIYHWIDWWTEHWVYARSLWTTHGIYIPLSVCWFWLGPSALGLFSCFVLAIERTPIFYPFSRPSGTWIVIILQETRNFKLFGLKWAGVRPWYWQLMKLQCCSLRVSWSEARSVYIMVEQGRGFGTLINCIFEVDGYTFAAPPYESLLWQSRCQN